MTLANKSLKPNSKNSDNLLTWAAWEEISKEPSLDATKGMKGKATPPKGKATGKASSSEKDYEKSKDDNMNIAKDNVGQKYSGKNKSNVGLPKPNKVGKTWVEDNYGSDPYTKHTVDEAVSFLDAKFDQLMEAEDPLRQGLGDDDASGATDEFGASKDDLDATEGQDDFSDELGDGSEDQSGYSVSTQYIQDLLSSKSTKIEVDSIEVSEGSSDEGDGFGGDLDGFGGDEFSAEDSFGGDEFGGDNEFGDGEVDFGDDGEEKLESYNMIDEAEEEELGSEFDSDNSFGDQGEYDMESQEEVPGSENVVQTFNLSFEVKSLTKGEGTEPRNLTLEIVEVDPQEKTCKAVLKDESGVNLESEVQKCNSSSNVESLVKEVVNKYFNTADPKQESKKMVKESKIRKGKTRKTVTEAIDIKNIPSDKTDLKEKGSKKSVKTEEYDELEDMETDEFDSFGEDEFNLEDDYLGDDESPEGYNDLDNLDDEEFNALGDDLDSEVPGSWADDDEIDWDNFDWGIEDEEEIPNNYDSDQGVKESAAVKPDKKDKLNLESTHKEGEEELEEGTCGDSDPTLEAAEIKQENVFLEYASKQGLDEAAAKDLYEMFKEAVSKKVQQEKVKLESSYKTKYEESLKLAESRMVKNADKYLSHITEEWKKENRLVLAESVKRRTSDKILNKVLGILTEGNIIVPESEVKVSRVFKEKNKQYKNKINSLLSENVELKAKVRENEENLKKASIFLEETSGLSEVSKDKVRALMENITFTNESAYRNKLRSVKTQILPKGNKVKNEPQRKTLNENRSVKPKMVSVDVNGEGDYIDVLADTLYLFQDKQKQ